MDLKLDDFELLPISSIKHIQTKKQETLYDITVEGNHTFFIKLPNSNDKVLMHNCDGSHITAMLIGWFRRFAPNLFDEGKICKLLTPNVILEDNKEKIVKYFMNIAEFKNWEANNRNHKYKVVYMKGLGSWSREQLIDLFETKGLESFICEYKLDDEGKTYIEDWLGNDPEKRKKYLREYTLDINNV